MPDLRKESFGQKSQKPKGKIAKREMDTAVDPDDEAEVESGDEHEDEASAEADTTSEPETGNDKPVTELTTEEQQNLPDIAAENDVASVPKGHRFLARFLNDPVGDTGHHAQQIMADILSGVVVRHGLSKAYWTTHSSTRPPIAESEGSGKYHLVEP